MEYQPLINVGREAHQLTQFVMASVLEYENALQNCPAGFNPHVWREEARRRLSEALIKGCSDVLEAPSRLMRYLERTLTDVEAHRTMAAPIMIQTTRCVYCGQDKPYPEFLLTYCSACRKMEGKAEATAHEASQPE